MEEACCAVSPVGHEAQSGRVDEDGEEGETRVYAQVVAGAVTAATAVKYVA